MTPSTTAKDDVQCTMYEGQMYDVRRMYEGQMYDVRGGQSSIPEKAHP